MRFIFLITLIILFESCTKPKSVLICGDHVCVNNDEAEQFFEENLTIEVRIIDKKIKNEIDLVELNLNENKKGQRQISILNKKETKKTLKTLTKDEIVKIKKNINNKKKEKNINKKIYKNESLVAKKNSLKSEARLKENKKANNNVNKNQNNVVDICTILEKCSIDEISKHLVEEGKKKKFPDITKRQQ